MGNTMAFKQSVLSLLGYHAIAILAYPGMQNADFMSRLQNRENANRELIGDLATLGSDSLSPIGREIKDILVGSGNALSDDSYTAAVPDLTSDDCAKDACCVWKHIADDLAPVFRNSTTGQCTDPARSAIRLGFHDAAGWSKATGKLGGADGSIVLAPEEITRPANAGLDRIAQQTQAWFTKYEEHGISMADLIQFNANLATLSCASGPRIKTYTGRKDSSTPATDGLLPSASDDSDTLIELFEKKTISASGLAALIGAHTASRQRFTDPSRAGAAQDSTPGAWDTLYYKQTLQGAPEEVFTFQSDTALSKDPRSSPAFGSFAQSEQSVWNKAYAKEYTRLSLLGVNNINSLTDCTKALPTYRN